MIKKVYLIHGWEGSPKEPMHLWIKKELTSRGFQVIAPEMPNPEEPNIASWINKLNEICKNPDFNTYFIGHSIGCQAIMRHIEKLPEKIKIRGAIFIAPWINLQGLSEEEENIAKPWLKTPIDFNKVKSHMKNIVTIFSDNDPFVPLSDKEIFRKKLKAKVIVEHDKGHYTQSDNVYSNPIVINKLIEISNK